MSDPVEPTASGPGESSPGSSMTLRAMGLLVTLFVFFLSLNLMSTGLKEMTQTAVEDLLQRATDNPFIGLFLAILATSIIQSSSATTTVVVTLAATNILTLDGAIPMIMGANIGTTVTNTLVSFTHIRRGEEFKRALAAGTVHDFFNILTVIVLFPLELYTHVLRDSAIALKSAVIGESFGKVSGLKTLIKPIVTATADFLHYPGLTLAVSLLILVIALTVMVKLMRSLFISRMARAVDRFLFRNAVVAFVVGIIFTILVQSSSVTTSLVVPLVGAGILTLRQVFPYTLGANIGTTVTAFLGALAVASGEGTQAAQLGVTVAVVHLLFNIFGIVLLYPLKFIPIWCAEKLAGYMAVSGKRVTLFVAIYFGLYLLPLMFIFLF